MKEEAGGDEMSGGGGYNGKKSSYNWKSKDKCMAIYRIDGKYEF